MDPNTGFPYFRRVVVPSDLGPGAEGALAHGWAVVLRARATLTVAHTVAANHTAEWRALPSPRDLLERWGVLAPNAGVEAYHNLGVRVELLAWSGEADGALTDRLGGDPADLLVLATHPRHGVDRLLHPSVASAIARHASCPALFLPDGAKPFVSTADGAVTLRRVLVPVARASGQQLAIDALVGLLETLGAQSVQIVLLHVGARTGFPTVSLPARPDWSYVNEARDGDVVSEILAAAQAHRVDLIVMATHGRDDLADLLRGSRTERVVRSATVPVLAVPAFA